MSNQFIKLTSRKEFIIFAGAILIVAILLTLLFAKLLYNSNISQISQKIETQSGQLERSFTDAIDQTAYLMDMMIMQIRPNTEDLSYVNTIMSKFRVTPKLEGLLSWTVFSWADKDYKIVVDGIYGVMDTPYDLSSRDYMPLTRAAPSEIHLGEPVYGSTSKRWMIPAGIGVLDDQGEYTGAMTIGFDIQVLTERLRSAFTKDGFQFVLLDKELNFIASSSEQTKELQDRLDKIRERILSLNSSSLDASSIKSSFSEIYPLGEQDSYLVHSFKKYPYILYVNYNGAIASRDLWESLVFRAIEIMLIGIAFLTLMILFYHRIIKPINDLSYTAEAISKGDYVSKFPRGKTVEVLNLSSQLLRLQRLINRERRTKNKLSRAINIIKESDLAYESFSYQVKNNMKKPIDALSEAVESLMMNNIGRVNPPFTKEQEQHSLKEAYKATLQLKTSVDMALHLEYVDITRVMNECIAIRSKDAIHKDIQIKIKFFKKLGRFYTDELKFKQLMLSLLKYAVDSVKPDTELPLKISTTKKDKERLLKIVIGGNEIQSTTHLNSKRVNESNKNKVPAYPDSSEFSAFSIMRVAKYLDGTVDYHDEQEHLEITILLPFKKKPSTKTVEVRKAHDKFQSPNIIHFQPKKDES